MVCLKHKTPDRLAAAGIFEFNLRFPGQYFDKETNLSYNYFRDYDSSIGRYIQPDPLGVVTTSDSTSTMSLNHLFAYVTSNPVSFSDPLGLFKYNAPPPRTVPVSPAMEAKVVCLENCLGVQLVITGGAEQKGHSQGSRHYSGQAVDFGFNSNPGIRSRNKEFFCCALQCGFDYGQTEGGKGPHYHLQTVSGLGVPRIPQDACMCKP
jgi:RHS repeat-associated protein